MLNRIKKQSPKNTHLCKYTCAHTAWRSLIARITPLVLFATMTSASAQVPMGLAQSPKTEIAPIEGAPNEGAQLKSTQTESNPIPKPSQRRRLNNYLDEIQRVEIEYGAYSNQLSEHLSGLGRAYQELGRHTEAIEIFERAAHVHRINNGLYNLNQVAIVESMVQSQIQLSRWQDASASKEYLLWLYENNYGNNDPRMLPVFNSLSNWFLSYHAMHYSWSSVGLVVKADNLLRNSEQIVSNRYGEHDLRIADVLKGQIRTNWYLRSMSALPSSQSSFDIEITDRATNQVDMDPDQRNLIYKYTRSKRAGFNAIHRLINLYANNPESPPGAEAQAIVELGDWNLLFGNPMGAMQTYKEAQLKLSSDERIEAQKQVEKLFGRPVALPNLPLLESVAGINTEEQPVTGYVVAQFDVTKQGNVRNIRILESVPENDVPKRRQVRMSLSSTKFRPRFIDGEPVPTEQMVHRYVFND